MFKGRMLVSCALCFVGFCSIAHALDADDLAELVGYTGVAASNVKGEFEGADYDKLVRLDNGMIFEFNEYSYTYSYRPTAVVFAQRLTPEEMRRLGPTKVPTQAITLYKLVVGDEMYGVTRIR